jgi:choice-of-anchor A domain-containing protein
MRSSSGLSFALALVLTLLFTTAAFAAQPHSWCVAGAPLVLGGGPDTTTNTIVGNVCGNFPGCCSTRWGLSCVQNAARYARDTVGAGDVCGRFAWAQGPIPGTGQFYPRDFNLFVTAGQANGIRDTQGPVAASSNINFSFFHVNNHRREPIALLGGGAVTLQSGTVNGKAIYRTTFSDPQVTYSDFLRPTAPTNPSPIDFPATAAKLIAMSQAIKGYTAIAATKANNTVTFAGTDPELNVFSLPSTMLTGTTTYTFNVPAGSQVIVNVLGTSAAIANAGLQGVPAALTLWNFPDATTLSISSVGFAGSILAPNATANLQNGSVAGTVVVKAATPANVELYMARYHVPSTLGARALDVDGSWSFTGYVSDDKTAHDFAAEAGFMEVIGGGYVAESQNRTTPTHRVWYSFTPAQIQAKTKPLVIFFNGGPGAATSSILFPFNTGNWTLDPAVAGANKIVATNPGANWSTFANLLYIDAPATGFSYPVQSGTSKPSVGIDLDRDAGVFNIVLLRFLKRHPEILANRVIIAGESYGGVRATFMLQHLYNYASLGTTGSPYIDLQVSNEERDYFSRVFGTTTPTVTQIATKFGHQALIQPAVAGNAQFLNLSVGTPQQFNYAGNCLSPTCSNLIPGAPGGGLPTCDAYNCDKGPTFSADLENTATTNLAVVNTLSTAVGANVRNIEWMKATSRTNAYGRNQGDIVPSPDMTAVFGALPSAEDNYFLSFNDAVNDGFPGAGSWSDSGPSLRTATSFANHLHNGVTTFITAAKFDLVIKSAEIPFGINQLGFLGGGVGYDQAFPTGLPRPGAFSLFYDAALTDGRTVTMPHVYNSGHGVTMRTPIDLLSDVKQWYNASPQ